MSDQMITIALSKGRILDETLPLLKQVGIDLLERPDSSRKLIFGTKHPQVQVLIVRATDVPTFVEHGAADLGVAGRDVLIEHGGRGYYQPLDLRIAQCKMMVAEMCEKAPHHPMGPRRRVATKYINIARSYFAEKAEQVDLIKLYGAMELAPVVGLADCIVDVVDTGNTLRANGLEPTELIMKVSSHLIVNKASFKTKHLLVNDLVAGFTKAVSDLEVVN